MRKGWEIKSLNDIAAFSQGIQVGLEKHETIKKEGYVRFIRIIDYTQNTEDIRYIPDPGAKYYVNEDDIVMVRYGSPGLVGRGKAGVIANNLFKITILRNDITNDYLTYFLSQDIIQKYLSSQGASTMPALNFGQLGKIEISFPIDINEQQEIVSILDDAFESIELAKSHAEQNLKNAKELFNVYLHKYFTNKEDGWEEKSLKEVAEYFNGLTYSPKNVSNEGMIVLRSSNIQEDKLDFKDIVRVDIKVKEKIIVRDGDILMCSRNGSQRLVGKTATIHNLNEVMTFGTFMMIIRSEYNPYLIWFFKSTAFKNQISSGENTMINQITRYMLDEISLSFPPVKIQNEIVIQLDSLSEKIKKLEFIYQQKLNDLEELKKSILQKAFNGELKTSKISA